MATEHETIDREGYDALWLWFGLTRASFLTLPRVMMHGMPNNWQRDMARLLNEFDDAFPNAPPIGFTVRCTKNGKLVNTPECLINYRRPMLDEIDKMRGDDRA